MNEISGAVKKAVTALFGVEIEPTINVPEAEFGDYATNAALVLSKQLGQNPREVAQQIADKISTENPNLSTSIAGPGFINFKLADGEIIKSLNRAQLAKTDLYQNKVVVAEFSDPNPFKVLHIGHLYTSIVGDAISRLIETAGGTVHRVNFGGDVGLHAAKTIWAVLRALGGENPEKLADIKENQRVDWLSKLYVEANRAYSDDDEARLEIVALNKRLYEITDSQDKKSNLAQIFWQTRQWSYDYFDQFYQQIGIKFEKYYPESEVSKLGLKAVQDHPEIYTKSNGAVVFEGEPYGLHTRVFVSSEGLPTYEAKDMGCTLQKYADYHFDEQIIITANDIVEYMKVVLKSLEQFAPAPARATKHFTHGMVKLPGGVKQSSRLGNSIKAVEVLELVAENQAAAQGNRDWATILGAVKYALLKNRLGPDVIFDPETSVSLTGNSGPYLQYAGARAKSILRKLPEPASEISAEERLDANERALAIKLIRYTEIVSAATAELAPHLICSYLFELAGQFNRFYENAKVAGHPRQNFRTALVKLYVATLDSGLNLLGIPTVEKM
ncbi:MAG: arginine--tRNA ligase [Candidatus Nomurabacteria bacterium]|jgi:arginyl-tRNA synthetase|nr:arginine--tRNA ligase [Candidatus Nomurabacteria bacterium]